jgi:hypothetical protein
VVAAAPHPRPSPGVRSTSSLYFPGMPGSHRGHGSRHLRSPRITLVVVNPHYEHAEHAEVWGKACDLEQGSASSKDLKAASGNLAQQVSVADEAPGPPPVPASVLNIGCTSPVGTRVRGHSAQKEPCLVECVSSPHVAARMRSSACASPVRHARVPRIHAAQHFFKLITSLTRGTYSPLRHNAHCSALARHHLKLVLP